MDRKESVSSTMDCDVSNENPGSIDHCNALNTSPIGVFDSGVGGLTVAKEIIKRMPNESIVYFGDTARVPYGGKSKVTITKYARQIVHFLMTKQVKAVVVACNTASALALDALQAEFEIPIIGVVKAGAKTAVDASRSGKIAVMGTRATIASGIYPKYIQSLKENVKVIQKACPLLVPLVEEGFVEDAVTEEIIRRYLSEVQESDIDTLVLGCTHYPLLFGAISHVMGDGVRLVNPAVETSKELEMLLGEMNLLNTVQDAKYEFYVSDQEKHFMEFANSILPDLNIEAVKVDLA